MRTLDPSEQRFVRHGTFTGRSVHLRGEVDAAALGCAFATLQRAFPVLVCRIVEDEAGNGILLRPGHIEPVGAWISFGEPDEIRVPTEPIDPGSQLAYLDVVLAEDDSARVTLFVHHSIADGGFCVELFSRFWGYYTDHVETGSSVAAVHSLPRSLEQHLADRGIERGTRSGLEAAIDVTSTVPAPVPAGPTSQAAVSRLHRSDRVLLDTATTARIREQARALGVSVNALITAAILRACADGGAARCLYPVDLRKRLSPVVAAEAGTNMGGLTTFATDSTDNLVEVAHRVGATLERDLADGVTAQSVLHFADYYGDMRIHSLAGHVAVTNTGIVPIFRAPAGLLIDDYEIVYLSAHPRPSAGGAAAVTFQLYSYLGRLTIGQLGGGPTLTARVLDHLAEVVASEEDAVSA
ncbi:phthiocerol/phthiodiolone dimycocerosyl transferase [Nocardia camponoti]|uniref:Phthiocerol/phthiodiolone dimycocerosyl transferase n=1 Tax=Nocardia camponoti TaxID=1616106 RepID=A0A917QPW7_9NOCA|nr:phthiocerol/phthiodiolone dimycocerosyl transferase [Nocardia camponoti]